MATGDLTRGARRCLLVGACAAAAVLLQACGAGSTGGPPPRTVVGVTERDFHITAVAHVAPGDVTLRIHNSGPDQHELIVARERRGGLPIRSDGFTINEEAIQNLEPGSLTPQEPGRTADLKLNLRPGRYLLFCNMAGHFMGGMHRELVVR